jgi:predicted DNA-binding transcriptional regulator AlpA
MAKATALERLRIGDAGDLLGVSRQRVQQLIRAERFPKPDALDTVGPMWNRETIENGGAATAGANVRRKPQAWS